MVDDVAIKVENVSKTFKLPHEKNSSIKGALVSVGKRKKGYERQKVLNGVSFEVKKGEFFGIVGRNGSGKSTLLKLLAGIYTPNKGGIRINGKLTPFIELGVGFNPELTGRENVYLNGALLGFNRKEMDAMYNDIVDFAELERFMDQKLKNYSSGMQVRLAFSIAIRAKSDILLIDEVLAVGDAAFQTKCFNYFNDLKSSETTVIFVSHDRTSLERFCDRGILIDDGELVVVGDISDVLKEYNSVILEELGTPKGQKKEADKIDSGIATIKNTTLLDKRHIPTRKVVYGDTTFAQFEVLVQKQIHNPILGMTVWQRNNNKAIYATNTLMQSIKTGSYKPGEKIVFTVKLPDILNDGEYVLEPAVADEAATFTYDKIQNAYNFFISGSDNPYSLISTPEKITIKRKT
jgi:ABC-2 type transport system ATP-binding protein